MGNLEYLESRKSLYEYFSVSINQAYRSLREKMKLDRVKKLKLFVIEFNLDVDRDTLKDLWKEVGDVREINVVDNDLYRLILRNENADFEFFWETVNDRIAYIYTLEDAKDAMKITSKFAGQIYEVDSSWYTHGFLKSIPYKEERYLRIARDPKVFYTRSEQELGEFISSVSITIRGMDTENYQYITEAARRELSLQSLSVKWTNEEDVVNAHIDYSGKFSIIGTSFPLAKIHIDQLNKAYLSIIKKIEREILINVSSTGNNSISVSGDTLILKYEDPSMIKKIGKERLVRRFIDGTRPFRLIGDAYRMGKDYFINAADLHFKGNIRISVYDEGIEVSADSESCGNTLLRFITNLTHAIGLPRKIYRLSGGDISWLETREKV